MFFILCFLGLRRRWQLGILAAAGFIMETLRFDLGIGRGVTSFFIGGLSFMLFAHLVRRRTRIRVSWLILANVTVWLFVFFDIQFQILPRALRLVLGPDRLAGHDVQTSLVLMVLNLVAFPLIIISLALAETSRGNFAKRAGFIGDISYSSYLIHFPLQLAVMCVVVKFGLDSSWFYSPLSMLLFFLVLIPLSLASYHWFERPVQSFLRSRLLGGDAAAENRAPPK